MRRVLSTILQLSGSIALVLRGDCDFTTKAKVAQERSSAALVVINTDEGVIFFYDVS